MKLDSTDSRSMAMANNVSGQENNDCAEILSCAEWCYMFAHHTKVQMIKERIEKETPFRVFVHTTKVQKSAGESVETQTVSGLVFIQGNASEIKKYLTASFLGLYLANDCATGETAVIKDSIMQPFIKLMSFDPSRIRFMIKPVTEYAKGNPLVRITSGIFNGLEGYIVRIDRDRKLVMAVGDMTVAVSGIHKESFENAEDYDKVIELVNNNR